MNDIKYCYIVNGYCGDCFRFWKIDGHGYTTDLNEAWKLTEKNAAKICSDPDRKDFAIYSDIAEKASRLHVNSEIYRELIRTLEDEPKS